MRDERKFKGGMREVRHFHGRTRKIVIFPEQDGWRQLLVFSVTPFKIDRNKNQNRSIDKVQDLGNERRYIYKDPRQDSGQRNISYTRYPKKCLPKFIEICMETPCLCSFRWTPRWRTETNRNICFRVLPQKREFILRGTHKQ